MLQQFKVMINSFAKKYGFEEVIPADQNSGIFNLAGFKVHIGLCETRKLILIQSAVGVIPEENQLELFSMLLSANNLFSKTLGATLGIDTKENLITLQVAWPVENLTYSKLEVLIENVLLLIGEWVETIHQFIQTKNTPISIEKIDPMGMLEV